MVGMDGEWGDECGGCNGSPAVKGGDNDNDEFGDGGDEHDRDPKTCWCVSV